MEIQGPCLLHGPTLVPATSASSLGSSRLPHSRSLFHTQVDPGEHTAPPPPCAPTGPGSLHPILSSHAPSCCWPFGNAVPALALHLETPALPADLSPSHLLQKPSRTTQTRSQGLGYILSQLCSSPSKHLPHSCDSSVSVCLLSPLDCSLPDLIFCAPQGCAGSVGPYSWHLLGVCSSQVLA